MSCPAVANGTGAPEITDPKKKEKKLEKDKQKADKAAKFAEKQAKMKADKAAAADNVKVTAKKDKEKPPPKDAATYDIPTKKGDKKDVSCELPASYSPLYVEAAWYDWWEHSGFFKPEYAVVVEKKLQRERQLTRHDLGREKFVEEVWKWKNEKGDTIYSQLRAMGISVDWDRVCFTMDPKMCRAVNEAFVRLHEKDLIYRSTRLVNWSCSLRSAISDIEVDSYGLRSAALALLDCAFISFVDKKELTGRTLLPVPGYKHKVEFGVLVYFAYAVQHTDEELLVATTRIETMLGDSAIAVHPDDDRYKHLVGRTCKHPFVDRELLIVADSFVEREFGSGAVKITPAHDHNDYEVGVRHQLPFITCIADNGCMTDNCAQFSGMKRFDARVAVIKALKEIGLYRDCKDNAMVVPICSRSKDVIEPILKPQWYVRCDKMAERAVEVVNKGELTLIPDMHVKTWMKWMDNMRDWCVSRQLWWGHRIPAYFVHVQHKDVPPGDRADSNYWVSARTHAEAVHKANLLFAHVPSECLRLEQDEDVLDTWFSAALFPFSVFGWPEQTTDLADFFPGDLLETGHDILFFWVARMVFFSVALTGKLPFKEVYLHAMIRDAHGRKMSKSLGNVIDPVDVIKGITLPQLHEQLVNSNLDPNELKKAQSGQTEDYPEGIPECGTDALRYELCAYTLQGRDMNLDVLRVHGARRFCNKIWQATKFALMQFPVDFVPDATFILTGSESAMDRWLLSRMSCAVQQCNTAFQQYTFTQATTALRNFWEYELCDVYLECVKRVMQSDDEAARIACQRVLCVAVDVALRLLSPFMPYITEELWQRLPRAAVAGAAPSICVAAYPKLEQYPFGDADLDSHMQLAYDLVKVARSMRSDYQLQNNVKTDMYVQCASDQVLQQIQPFECMVQVLSNAKHTHLVLKTETQAVPPGCAMQTVSDKCNVHLLLKGIIDYEKETKKLAEKQIKLTQQLDQLNKLTSKEDYELKVPETVRAANQSKKDDLSGQLMHLDTAIQSLQQLLI